MHNGIREAEVRDLADLIRLVTPQHPDPDSGRLRARVVFRGVTDTEYSLLTSLDRLGTPELPPHSKAHLEAYLVRSFIRYSRPHLPVAPINDLEVLVVAQHHGLPTRLLDWSYSPLAAAHFATTDDTVRQDRVIWRLDWGRMHDHFGLPPLAMMVEDLERVLHQRGIGSMWDLFSGKSRAQKPFVALLEPPALDNRIVAQSAAFTFSTDRTCPIDQILIDAGLSDCLMRCVIPAEAVERLRDQLDLCGIDERRLFPDLDGVAAEMRRYYAASGWQPHPGEEPEIEPLADPLAARRPHR